MITYNGNEMMLQNDMGNTLIQDSKTGHIMGLSEGFVPVGLKEHGGIMYVISANKEGVGEIGTIPSPILKLELRREELSQAEVYVTTSAGPSSTVIGITNFKVYPGEKFLPALNLVEEIVDLEVPQEFTIQDIGSTSTIVQLKDRLISPVIEGEGCSHTGLYELKLFSIYGSQVTELKHVYKKPMHPFLKDGTQDMSHNYWYYPDRVTTNVDIEQTWLNKGLHTYPGNLPPGKLAVKAELETIEYFDLPKISQSKQSKQQGTKAPYIYKKSENGVENYILAFPGFEYKTNSIRFIGELDITLTNQTTGEYKCTETINGFATVDISTQQNQYQIQQSEQSSYKKIEVEGPYQDTLYFTPLFEVNIGQDLNAWYRLEVKYKDIYGGNIDTFVYSFNPYHILNYDESYYEVEWKADKTYNQFYLINSNDSTTSFTPEKTILTLNNNVTPVSRTQKIHNNCKNHITFGRSATYREYENGDFCQMPEYFVPQTCWTDNSLYDFTLTGTFKSYDCQYLYDKLIAKWESENPITSTLAVTSNYILPTTDTCNITTLGGNTWSSEDGENWTYNIYTSPSISVQPDELGTEFKQTFKLTRERQIDNPPLEYSSNLDFEVTNPLSFLDHQGTYSQGNPVNDVDGLISSIQLSCSWEGVYGGISMVGQPTYFNNQSQYQLNSSFSLFGNTDEELGLRLGLDRTGEAKKAWTFGQNLYQTSMPDKNTTDTKTSTFEKNAYYYDETAVGNDLLLDAGVYLITADAGMFNTWDKYYAKDGDLYKDESGKEDVNQYGSNTDWGNNNFNPQYPTNEDPRIAVVIQNTYYQITRVDSQINGTNRRTFMPTLLYLPKQSIIRVEWKNVQKLQGIGVFRVTKPIVFNDGVGFDEGSDIKVMYYQHPDLREIILPIEATYQEQALCLGKTYDYYPGLQSLSYVNRHVNMTDDSIKFGAAPDRQGTWNYKNIDPTYIWDPNGTGLMEFIYQYEKDNHTQSTEIPSIAGNSSRLEYRKLNSTT